MDYSYKKAILYEFKNNKSYVKVIIKDNEIICNNDIIKKDIHSKYKNNIKYVEFYTSLYDYEIEKEDEYWNVIKVLPLNELPIYRKNNNFDDFIEFYSVEFNNENVEIYETSKYTKRKHIFINKDECLKSVVYEKTNPKYDNFIQLFYHAGDTDDIERYGYLHLRCIHKYNNIKPETNLFNIDIWDKYKVSFNSIKNTMNYMLNVMKKGILVCIKDNKLLLFMPFSKRHYQNDYWDELYFDDNDKRLLKEYRKNKDNNILDKLKNTVKYYANKYHLREVELDRRKWVMNDCFFSPKNYEGDQNEALYEDFLVNLCKERKLPDAIFFVNLRDHGVLNKNLKYSYDDIVDKEIDEEYKLNPFCPILSFGANKNNADISIPTNDDLLRISQKIYPDDCKNGYYNAVNNIIKWEDKINKCVFRGSATGCHIDDENLRLKSSKLSDKYPDILDAGVISLNRKLKKTLHKPFTIIDNKNVKLKSFMSLDDKSKHKYILTIDGHASAYRLSHELSLNSVLLIPKSKYYLWFSHLLKPMEHYVPVNDKLDDLIDKIKWCIDNDAECKRIASNAVNFYNKYLSKDGIYNYYSELLWKISPENLNFKMYDKKIAIITIFRDKKEEHSRLNQKRLFIYYMNKILHQICEYKIILVEQSQGDYFNIGKCKNIGFKYLEKETFDNYIFCDIDTIPDTDLIPYIFKITDGINALATYGTRYDASNIFFGACISSNKENFIKVNGYPNTYIKWGYEDDNLIFRCIKSNITIYKNKKGKIIDLEYVNGLQKSLEIKNNEEKIEREMNSYEKLYYDIHYDKYKNNGLNTLFYNLLYEYSYDNTSHIIVDLQHEEYVKKYPDYFEFDFTFEKTQFKDFKHKLRNDAIIKDF